MVIRLLTLVLVVASSIAFVNGQAPEKPDNGVKPPNPAVVRNRDIPFPGGVDLKFIISELARDLGLNVCSIQNRSGAATVGKRRSS